MKLALLLSSGKTTNLIRWVKRKDFSKSPTDAIDQTVRFYLMKDVNPASKTPCVLMYHNVFFLWWNTNSLWHREITLAWPPVRAKTSSRGDDAITPMTVGDPEIEPSKILVTCCDVSTWWDIWKLQKLKQAVQTKTKQLQQRFSSKSFHVHI